MLALVSRPRPDDRARPQGLRPLIRTLSSRVAPALLLGLALLSTATLSTALLSTPVMAQDGPAADPVAAEMEALRFELMRERVHRLIQLAEQGAGENTQLRERLAAARDRVTDELVRRTMTERNPRKALEVIYGEEIRSGRVATSDFRLDSWYERNMRNAYRLTEITADRMPVRNGYNPPVTEGYLPEVAAIDNRASHSMSDLRDYLGNRFTNAALESIVTRGRPVEIHVGDISETLTSFQNRGYEMLGEIKSANGNYERLFVAKSPSGQVTYAITGIDGVDRVRHLSSLLRFAGPNGEGVPAERVRIFGDMEALKARNVRTFENALRYLGDPGGMAWIGFRGGVNAELTRRAMAMRGAEHARDVLGTNPHEGLIQRLEAELRGATGEHRTAVERVLQEVRASEAIRGGLAEAPAGLLAEAARVERFKAMEAELVRLAGSNGSVRALGELVIDGAMRLPGGASAKTFTASRTLEHSSFRAEELIVRTAEGTRSLKLINNYYGDVMGDMGRALARAGYRNVAYFGTAGGLAEGVRIGDVHVPNEIYGHDGRRTGEGLRNELIEVIERSGTGALGERVRTNTRLANVFTPVQETMPWMENARRTGMASVEVENSYLAEELARHNRRAQGGDRIRFLSSVMISDLPGTAHTLGNNNGSTAGNFERMVDNYIKGLGIEEIYLMERDAVSTTGRGYSSEAERAAHELARRYVTGENNLLLRENVATRLVEWLSPEQLSELSRNPVGVEELPLTEEQRSRLRSEIEARYADRAVLESLRGANGILTQAIDRLRTEMPNSRFELRLGGGLEAGEFSPRRGVEVELRGDAQARARFAELLAESTRTHSGAPPVRLVNTGALGESVLNLGRGDRLVHEYGALKTLHAERLLATRRINLHVTPNGGRIAISPAFGPIPGAGEGRLYSRYERYDVGPNASRRSLERFREKVARRGGVVELVPSSDPRLNGAQGRTLIDAEGRLRVLLPADRPVKSFALIDELTHVLQLSNLARAQGSAEARRLLAAAEAGDPVARSRLIEWEIKAKRSILLTLPQDAPERAEIEREIQRLRAELDPYARFRTPSNGRINWDRVRQWSRQHGAGAASFTLGIFLKELASAVESGDPAVIEAFFEGLKTTDFWLNYAIFSISAEAGSVAYGRYLERFVKPGFMNGILKSNVALASGMALSEIAMGHFSGKTYAINLAGLMLSSSAVKVGLAGLRWVVALDRLSGARRLAQALRLGSVPGWIYAGVETAVVLYFGEAISGMITRHFERNRLRQEVRDAVRTARRLVSEGRDPEDEELATALSTVALAFSEWRNFELEPAMAAGERFQSDMRRLGQEAHRIALAEQEFEDMAGRSGSGLSNLERLAAEHRRRKQVELDAEIAAAGRRYEESLHEAIRGAYEENRRRSSFDPSDASNPSRNRGQSFEDERAVYAGLLGLAADETLRGRLQDMVELVEDIQRRDRELLIQSTGAAGALREENR